MVAEDGVRPILTNDLQGNGALPGDDRLVAGTAEAAGKEVPDRRFVVENQDASRLDGRVGLRV
jgi:hypothetical protein